MASYEAAYEAVLLTLDSAEGAAGAFATVAAMGAGGFAAIASGLSVGAEAAGSAFVSVMVSTMSAIPGFLMAAAGMVHC